jgi:hypothetical protein
MSIKEINKLNVFLTLTLKIVLVFAGLVIYINCFTGSFLFMLIMSVLFGYILFGIASRIVNLIVYFNTKPLILKQNNKIIEQGLTDNRIVAMFRPMYASSKEEAQINISNIEKDINNNKDLGKNIKYILLDNSEEQERVEESIKLIKKMQKKYGEDIVFYLHRSNECNFAKKFGVYMDAFLLLSKGLTKPSIYKNIKWSVWVDDTRNSKNSIFDVVLGDISALGINAEVEDIVNGDKVEIDVKKKLEIAFISDADNVWEKGEVIKLIAKMKHAENKDITIFQPSIKISNSEENGYTKLSSWAKDMIKFDSIANWRLFHFAPFCGKGAINVNNYIEQIIDKEYLHPGRSASHDFQESLGAWTVLLEDVFIKENTFSNKSAEFTRKSQWQWGDWETIRQYWKTKFEKGRRSHLYALVRGVFSNFVFGLWLIFTILTSVFKGGIEVKSSGLFLFFLTSIALINIVVSNFLGSAAGQIQENKTKKGSIVKFNHDLITFIGVSCVQSVVYNLIYLLDLIYQPIVVINNMINQYQGKPFEWKTCAMLELETTEISLIDVYKKFKTAVITSIVLIFLTVIDIIPVYGFILLLPFIISFIAGPALVWYSAKPLKKNK